MIGDNPKFDVFISEHRWAAMTTLRKSGTPVTAMVAYAREGDTLVVSTPGYTFRRRTLEHDPRMNLCIINGHEPFNYVTVEGTAEIETDDLEGPTRAVFANIQGLGYDEPEDLAGWLEQDQRVIVRLTPDRVSGVIR